MPPAPHDPHDRKYDPDSTDTLPLPVLREEDTGRLAALDEPAAEPQQSGREAGRVPELEPAAAVRVRPRMAVRDVGAGSHASTDTFHPATLMPMAARPAATSDLAETLREQERQLQQANERLQHAEGQLQQARQRLDELQAQLEVATRPSPEPAAAPAPAAQGDEAAALRRQNARLHEALSSMHARVGVQEAMLAEADAALQTMRAAPSVTLVTPPPPPPPPDADADAPAPGLRIDWPARFKELETVLEAERDVAAARSQAQADELAALQAELDALRSRQAQPATLASPRSLPIGSMLRVLVREEDGTELVYPLGRHTTIGRTPDNDIQVSTTFVSRHHAVLLTSSDHCIVEDLNSTNGIIVNGQRVGRQLLHDGDVLTIGKTHFRYETRP